MYRYRVPLIHLTSGQVCVHRVCGLQTVSTAIKKLSFRNVLFEVKHFFFVCWGSPVASQALSSKLTRSTFI